MAKKRFTLLILAGTLLIGTLFFLSSCVKYGPNFQNYVTDYYGITRFYLPSEFNAELLNYTGAVNFRSNYTISELYQILIDNNYEAELINRVGNEAEEIILVALPQADYTAYYYISATINCYQITNLGIQKKLWNAEQEKEETVYMLFPVHTISNSDTQPSVEENKECVTETFDYFAEFYRKGAKNNNTVIDEENKTIIFTNIYNDKVSMHWSEDFNGDFWIEFN